MADKRNTIQKDIILNAVLSICDHPSAEAVYEQVKLTHPRISKATVYRNLNQLAEDGVVRRLHLPNGADFYDFRTDDHYHLRCEGCGKISDVPLPYQRDLCAQAMADGNCQIKGHNIIFYGLCAQCKNKN